MFMFSNDIVVPLDLGGCSSARLKLAIDLATRFEARLIGIAAREASRAHGHGKGGLITSKMIDSEKHHAVYELSRVEAAFRKETESLADAEFASGIIEPATFLINKTRTSDLVLCNRPYDGDLDEWFADLSPGDLLMRLGCPLLIAPFGCAGPVGRRIVVAWKDTREARRAVREAWPFLRTCESVAIVTVGSTDDARGANDIADAMKRRGIPAKAVVIDKRRPRVSAEILAFAGEQNADLLVAGACGHARVHEFIFGSVTRDLLEGSEVSCLLTR